MKSDLTPQGNWIGELAAKSRIQRIRAQQIQPRFAALRETVLKHVFMDISLDDQHDRPINTPVAYARHGP
jgi:hypothetical protein